MILEIAINITAALEVAIRITPCARVRISAYDIGWDGGAREEPDADVIRCPLCGVDAARDSVEGRAVGAGVVGGNGTAKAVVLVAVVGLNSSGGQGTGDGAYAPSVMLLVRIV